MNPATRRKASIAAAAALLAAGCGDSWSFRSRHGGKEDGKSSGGVVVTAGGLALEESPGGRTRSVRIGAEIVLAFSAPLDPATGRGAVRVEDGDASRGLLPVEVDVRGRHLVLRSAEPAGWRPGRTLRVKVAGLPSLRALRGIDGTPLARDLAVPIAVRSPRRTDRVPPTLEGMEPPPGAVDADPASPVVLRFSEPMDPRILNFTARGSAWDPVRLEAEGRALPFRAFPDRDRRVLTLLPLGGLPPSTEITVVLGERLRDAAGNSLWPSNPWRHAFTTGPWVSRRGLLVEAFEDRAGMDPLGTTVRWDHPAAPGVLSGAIEPAVLVAGAPGSPDEERALLLDPRGGRLVVHVAPEELGEEPRVLRGIRFRTAPGGGGAELLDPRLRVAAVRPGQLDWAPPDREAWREVTDGLPGLGGRGAGGGLPMPFLHPFPLDGAGGLLVELTWSGTVGKVFLQAGVRPEARARIDGWGPEPVALHLSPVMELDAVGERPVARSLWFDSGEEAPTWAAPILPPLPGDGAVLRLQGAPAGPGDHGPDLSRASAWTGDPADLAGLRWIRFRVEFGGEGGGTPVALDRIDLPYETNP